MLTLEHACPSKTKMFWYQYVSLCGNVISALSIKSVNMWLYVICLKPCSYNNGCFV